MRKSATEMTEKQRRNSARWQMIGRLHSLGAYAKGVLSPHRREKLLALIDEELMETWEAPPVGYRWTDSTKTAYKQIGDDE